MAICSYCSREDSTVDRNRFDGMCASCTDRSLSEERISKKAIKENNKLKNEGRNSYNEFGG